jgi:hypothetical protein
MIWFDSNPAVFEPTPAIDAPALVPGATWPEIML